MTAASNQRKKWARNKCIDCGVWVPMRQKKKEGTRCDSCTMRNNIKYRRRMTQDDSGVVYQDAAE